MADDGLAEVLARMQAVSLDVDRTMRTALRAGARVVRDAARTNAQKIDNPATPASIPNSIITQNYSKAAETHMGGVGVMIGVKGGAKEYANTKRNRRKGRVGQTYQTPGNVFYWRFFEFGTRKMAARPFMRPAFDNSQGRVLGAIEQSLTRAINRAGKP